MGFEKGHPQFNTGRTHFKNGQKAPNWNGFVKGDKPIHTGKTKDEFPALSNSGSKKGCIPWNKGKKLSETHKQKAIKNLVHGSGERNNFWKGGTTAKSQIIRTSRDYALWRTAVFMRDGYTCQKCGERGGTLHADHIKPFSTHPELRFAIDNGRTLCVECHKQTPTYGKPYSFLIKMAQFSD